MSEHRKAIETIRAQAAQGKTHPDPTVRMSARLTEAVLPAFLDWLVDETKRESASPGADLIDLIANLGAAAANLQVNVINNIAGIATANLGCPHAESYRIVFNAMRPVVERGGESVMDGTGIVGGVSITRGREDPLPDFRDMLRKGGAS